MWFWTLVAQRLIYPKKVTSHVIVGTLSLVDMLIIFVNHYFVWFKEYYKPCLLLSVEMMLMSVSGWKQVGIDWLLENCYSLYYMIFFAIQTLVSNTINSTHRERDKYDVLKLGYIYIRGWSEYFLHCLRKSCKSICAWTKILILLQFVLLFVTTMCVNMHESIGLCDISHFSCNWGFLLKWQLRTQTFVMH